MTVTDLARGTTVSTTTNDQGLFEVRYLLAGTYSVTVELQGFKKYVQEKVPIEIVQTLNLAIVLEVGGVQESVSCHR